MTRERLPAAEPSTALILTLPFRGGWRIGGDAVPSGVLPPHRGIRLFCVLLGSCMMTVMWAPIMIGLAGVFVIWLSVVGFLLTTTMVSDLGRRCVAWLARLTVGGSHQRTAGCPSP